MDSYMAAKQITSVYAAVLTPRLVDDSVGFLRQELAVAMCRSRKQWLEKRQRISSPIEWRAC